MAKRTHARRSAVPGWRTAALAIAGSFSLAQCGGQIRGTDPSSRDAASEGAVEAKSESDDGSVADVVTIDVALLIDAGVPTGGVCPVLVDAEDAGDAAPPPAGGICM